MQGSPKPKASAAAMIGLALALLILPIRWLFGAVTAALFHELCHWTAIMLCGGSVSRFSIGSGGAVMAAENLSRGKELVCALAGPAGGLLLLLVSKWLPVTALCALIQSAYNLLPIYPLDGGRVLRCAVLMLLPPKTAAIVIQWTERLCLLTILILCLYAALILKMGFFPIVIAAALFLKKNSLQTDPNESTMEILYQKG